MLEDDLSIENQNLREGLATERRSLAGLERIADRFRAG